MLYYYSFKDNRYVAYSTDGEYFYSPNGDYIGYRHNGYLYSQSGNTIGYFNEDYLYSQNGQALWYKS